MWFPLFSDFEKFAINREAAPLPPERGRGSTAGIATRYDELDWLIIQLMPNLSVNDP